MNLTRVTITGADDSTPIQSLADLSAEFPFVEWGILVSRKREGSYRFPSREWIERFSSVAKKNAMAVSTHICGSWIREMFVGKLEWRELPMCIHVSQRVQLNTHAESQTFTIGLLKSLSAEPCKQFIFQWDGVNGQIAYFPFALGLDVAVLFDTSGGAGKLPDAWPVPKDLPCGYAGGLGPDNVAEQVQKIEAVCDKPYWIDMERRVRTPDDSMLDLDAVRQVLSRCRFLGVVSKFRSTSSFSGRLEPV